MRKKRKLIITIIGVLVAAVAVAAYNILIADHSITGDAGVAAEYYTKTNPQGVLETKYNSLGELEVNYIEYEIEDSEAKKLHVWYPKDLETSDDKYPLVVMVNGSTLTANSYKAVFEHLASWGFVVIGDENEESNTGHSTSVILDWMLKQNEDSNSVFYHKLDVKNIGLSGHSQGGTGAINAATIYDNSHYYTSLYTASGASMWASKQGKYLLYDVSKIKIPYFMMAGTEPTDRFLVASPEAMKENYESLPDGTPAVLARRKGIDHADALEYGDAYMTAWFRYTLMNDEEAGKVFVGDNAELRHNQSWTDVKIKNLP